MITSFRGEYSFLSNFTPFEVPMKYAGNFYPSNEHFYQAMKMETKESRGLVCKHPSKGLKDYVRTLKMREDWENIKDSVMWFGLKYKFSYANPKLRLALLNTGDVPIQEGNWWGDKYWGVCLKTGEGENTLGKMLMKLRGEII